MSLSSILKNFKSGIEQKVKDAKASVANKPAAVVQEKTLPTVTKPTEEMVRQFDGQFVPKSQARNKYGGLIYGGTLSAAPSRLESFEAELSRNPVTGERETGGYLDKVVTMGYNAPSALSTLLTRDIPVNTFFGGLDVRKTAGAAGNVLGGIPAAIPQAGIGLAESTEGVSQAKGVKDTAIKLTSVPTKTLMPFMNLIPGVMAFQFGTQSTGLDEKTNKGVASAKSGVSDVLQKTGLFSKEEADELSSNGVDMLQLGLSFFGGAKSTKTGTKTKVSEIARQEKVSSQLKTIEKDARSSGLSRADAKQFAKETAPMVQKSTPTTLLSDVQVLTSNLKNIGIDVAANSIIPVLGLAYENYKNSGNDDVVGAIREAAIQVGAMAIPGVKVKGKTPDINQTKLDVDNAKSPTSDAPVAPAKSTKPLSQMLEQDYTVNRDTANVLTTKDLQKYAIENAESLLASGKWINGKKLKKNEVKLLEKIVERKAEQKAQQAETLAGNQGQVFKETPLLPEKTGGTVRADAIKEQEKLARSQKTTEMFTRDFQDTQKKITEQNRMQQEGVQMNERLAKEFEQYLIDNTPKPLAVTTLPDYTKLSPLDAAREAQAEFNRINDFYEGNIPSSAMDRVKYLSTFVDNLDLGKATNIDMNQIFKDNIYRKWLMSKGLDTPAFMRRATPDSVQPQTALERKQAGLIPVEGQVTPRTALERKTLSQMLKEQPLIPGEVDTVIKDQSLDTSGSEYMPIREITPDVAEYLDASVDSLISKGKTKNDIFPRAAKKIEENIGRRLTTLESEHLGKVIDAKIAGQDIKFIDINQKPAKGITTNESPTEGGADFIEATQGKQEKGGNPIEEGLKQSVAPVSDVRLKAGTIAAAPNLYATNYALNNILVKVGNQMVEGGAYVTAIARGIRKTIGDKIAEDSGVVANKDKVIGSDAVLDIPLEGLVVRDAMTDSSQTITKGNIKDYQKSIDFTARKAASFGIDPIAAVRRHIYRLTEGNQAIRDKYFTKEEQVELNAIFEQAYNEPRKLQKKLQDDGFIGEENKLYEHAVTDIDRVPESSKTVKLEIGKEIVEFKTEAEARSYLDIQKKAGKLTDEQYKAANVGILKHRNDARLNAFRSLDPVTQLYSYADDVGRMYGNRQVLSTLEGWRENKKVGKSLDGYFGEDTARRRDIRMTLLDIYDMPQTWYGKTYRAADNGMSYLKLVGFGQNFLQGVTFSSITGAGKAVAQALTTGDTKALKSAVPVLFDNNTMRQLEREGFVPKSEYLGNDMSDVGRLGIDIGTAQIVENAYRASAATALMRKEILRAHKRGLSGKLELDSMKNDAEVIKAWNDYVSKGDPSSVTASRANISSDLQSFGDASNQGRYDAPYFGRVSKKFKGFFATVAGRLVGDVKNQLDAVVNLQYGDMHRDSSRRLITLGVSTYATYEAAKLAYEMMGDSEEMAEEKAKDFLKWSFGGILSYIKDPLGNAISMPIASIPLGFGADVKDALSKGSTEQQIIGIENAFRKNIGILRDSANWLKTVGIDVMQSSADKLGTANPEYMTRGGVAKGYNSEYGLDALAEIFGRRGEVATERIILNKLEESQRDKPEAGSWTSNVIDKVMRYKEGIAEYNTIWKNADYLLRGNGEDVMKNISQAQYTHDVLKVLRDSKTEGEFFDRLGISQDYRGVIRAELFKQFEGQFKDNRRTEESINTTTFADTTMTPNFTNIDSATYFKRSPEEKIAYWEQINRIKPTGLTPQDWVNMEKKDLGLFNKEAEKFIFGKPSEYPMSVSVMGEGETLVDKMRATEKSNPRGYNDMIAYLGNLKAVMDQRVEDGTTALPVLEGAKRDITKKNLEAGVFVVDPTKVMTNKEYADLLERQPTLKNFFQTVKGSKYQGDQQELGYGQFATPQDDAVIANFNKTKDLTTYVSTQFSRAVNELSKAVKQGTTSSSPLDISGSEEKLVELEGVLGFIKENELNTEPFRTSVESALANSYQVWEKLKSLRIKDNFPNLYGALISGLAIRGEKAIIQEVAQSQEQGTDLNVTKSGTQPTQPTSRKLSESLGLMTPVTAIEGGVIPEKNPKKPAQLKDKFIRVEGQPQRVMSLSELLRSKK